MLKKLLKHQQENKISYRLLVYIILCSSLMTMLTTVIQLYWDYRRDVVGIEQTIESINSSYLGAMASSLWKLDKEQIAIQLDGIMKLPDISYSNIIEIVADQEESVFVRGQFDANLPLMRTFELFHRETLVGRLEIGASYDHVYQRLVEKFFIILGSQAIKTFLVSVCILILIHYLIVKHLHSLASHTQQLGLDNLDEDFNLEKNFLRGNTPDELDQLTLTLNQMRVNIRRQLLEKQKAQQALENMNLELEQRVIDRTAALQKTNEELTGTIDELTRTKDKLVETEKMAALGSLVAGVAHEINTPVGNSLLVASSLNDNAKTISQDIENGSLSKTALTQFLSEVEQGSHVLLGNLDQAAKLIASFKQVAVERTNNIRREFSLQDTLQETLLTLSPMLKHSQYQIETDIAGGLLLDSYPGAIGQIMTNLVANSLVHGFEEKSSGSIRITGQQVDDEMIKISVSDDGHGMDADALSHIFDPFFTSKLGMGGSGLGMHIVYNLVTGVLGGTLSASSEPGQGLTVDILIPRVAPT